MNKDYYLAPVQFSKKFLKFRIALLMSYQIIFPGYFGNDDDFISFAVQLFLEILNV